MANTSIFNMVDTWNNGATVFNGISMDVTETGAAAGSLYLNFKTNGTTRFSATRQDSSDQNPGAGNVIVKTATGDRTFEFSHYQYGGMIRGRGTSGERLELFLGDVGTTPELSVRGYTSTNGAKIQARDGADLTGLQLDFSIATRPRLALEDNASSPNELSFEHPRSTGFLTFRVAGAEVGRWTAGGLLTFGGITTSFPALRRNSAILEARLGDNSNFADFKANTITCNSGFNANGNDVDLVGKMILVDGVTAPSATSGRAKLYIDTTDGDLKIIFGDGTIKTIVVDT